MAVCPKCTYFNHPEIKSCEVCDFNLNKQAKKTRLLNDGMTERFMEECSALDDKQIINFNSIASTEGIIELMEELLQAESKKTPAINYRLCSPCHHITQKGFEGAHWSCGYRNIQMLCYALLKGPEYKANLFNGDGDIPDVYGIQTWIEKAWKAGFDVMGCQQLGGKLLGRDIWIGATECVALLRFFGVRCVVVQFQDFQSRERSKLDTSNPWRCNTSSSSSSSVTRSRGHINEYFEQIEKLPMLLPSSSPSVVHFSNDNSISETFEGSSNSNRIAIPPLPPGTSDTLAKSENQNTLQGLGLTQADFDRPDFDWNAYIAISSDIAGANSKHDDKNIEEANTELNTSSSAYSTETKASTPDLNHLTHSCAVPLLSLSVTNIANNASEPKLKSAEKEVVEILDYDDEFCYQKEYGLTLPRRYSMDVGSEPNNEVFNFPTTKSLQQVSQQQLESNYSNKKLRVGRTTFSGQYSKNSNGQSTKSEEIIKISTNGMYSYRSERRRILCAPTLTINKGNTSICRDMTGLTRSKSKTKGKTKKLSPAAENVVSPIGKTVGYWVKTYFDSFQQGAEELVPPLYFQHEGHSRTIIGYEETEVKFSLLVFDPCTNGTKLKENLLQNTTYWKQQVKRSLTTLNRNAFQIVRVLPGIMSEAEREFSKVIEVDEVVVRSQACDSDVVDGKV